MSGLFVYMLNYTYYMRSTVTLHDLTECKSPHVVRKVLRRLCTNGTCYLVCSTLKKRISD